MPSPSACLLGYDASKYPQCNLRSGKPGMRFWHLMSPGPPQPPALCRSVNFLNSLQVRGGPLETVLPSASCLQGNYGFPQTGILPESYRGTVTFPKTRRMPCSSASQLEGKPAKRKNLFPIHPSHPKGNSPPSFPMLAYHKHQ